MFMRFTMHYRYKADFCNPDSPHEKGSAENKVGYIRRNYLLPPPEIENLDDFNRRLLDRCMEDLYREHYVRQEKISELFASEQESLVPLPRERFRVFELIKEKTDKYSFIRIDKKPYSTSPEYIECEMWLETGPSEIRILNGKYEFVASRVREYGGGLEPVINFDNYIETLTRKPRAFLNPAFFPTLPEIIQEKLKSLSYGELKKMLLTPVPIIRDGKPGDAAGVLELSVIRSAGDFSAAYRALTEDPREIPSVTTPLTPKQQPYLPKPDPYTALSGGKAQ